MLLAPDEFEGTAGRAGGGEISEGDAECTRLIFPSSRLCAAGPRRQHKIEFAP